VSGFEGFIIIIDIRAITIRGGNKKPLSKLQYNERG